MTDFFSYLLSLMHVLGLSFFILLFGTSSATSQYINIHIDLEPEFKTEVLTPLNFGQIVNNSGNQVINLGDPRMGIFSITAINAQSVKLTIDHTKTLKHSNLDITDSIPFDIKAAYNNTGTNDHRSATPFVDNQIYAQISRTASKTNFSWETLYIYIFGSIEIGSIQDGVYTGNIYLTVEFD